MSGYEVSPTELKAHASSFGALAKQVHTASEAAQAEGIMGGGNPYGLLFTPLILPTLGLVCAATQGFLKSMCEVGDGIEKSLHDNVDIYTEAERANTTMVGKAMP